jgi:hypothetical protein
MSAGETVTGTLYGMYSDVLRNARGEVLWESGWRKNTIVTTCRILLASFMRGTTPSPAIGIQGLQVGAGLPDWDNGPLPTPDPGRTTLVDPHPFLVDPTHLKIDFLDGNIITTTPTNRLQIVATLDANMPNWPDGNPNHTVTTLREFGLIGQLGGAPTLINYVAHTAIAKDPQSTLERTIWLTF